jgi:hypothetical protein
MRSIVIRRRERAVDEVKQEALASEMTSYHVKRATRI